MSIRMENKECYKIHDNGGRPFTVSILNHGKEVRISTSHPDKCDEYVKFVTYHPKKIFIGTSEKNEMTEFGGGYGENFDGNTILLHMGKRNYILISESIFIFRSKNPIITFSSPVGNNDVPYPFAIDDKDYIYLLLACIILEPSR